MERLDNYLIYNIFLFLIPNNKVDCILHIKNKKDYKTLLKTNTKFNKIIKINCNNIINYTPKNNNNLKMLYGCKHHNCKYNKLINILNKYKNNIMDYTTKVVLNDIDICIESIDYFKDIGYKVGSIDIEQKKIYIYNHKERVPLFL